MTQQVPPPLPYASLATPRTPFGWGKFFAAFLIGTAVSAVVWIGAWEQINNENFFYLVFILPAVKIVVAVLLLINRNWRSAGIGLLVSLFTGFGIFFTVCASEMTFH